MAAIEVGFGDVSVNAILRFRPHPPMSNVLGKIQLNRGRTAIALPRLIEPTDIAAGLGFLVNDLASAITRRTFVIDIDATTSYTHFRWASSPTSRLNQTTIRFN
jgi:hypothetical protein